MIVSFLTTQRKYDDPEYDPYPESISIHHNSFSGTGGNPQGEFLSNFKAATGQPVPDIVFDGILDQSKLVDGEMPVGMRFSIKDNGEATFVNLDLGAVFSGQEPSLGMDLGPYAGSLPAVDAVSIPGVE